MFRLFAAAEHTKVVAKQRAVRAPMSQRPSGYERRPNEDYKTVAWPVAAVLPYAGEIAFGWDPCDDNPGPDKLVTALHALDVAAVGTSTDFFTTAPPPGVTHLVTNPSYGEKRRGVIAERFIACALELRVPGVAMLLKIDSDSGIKRQHVFRNDPAFAAKVVLLGRIRWFPGSSSPSDNHCWLLFDQEHRGASIIHYALHHEAKAEIAHAFFGLRRKPPLCIEPRQ